MAGSTHQVISEDQGLGKTVPSRSFVGQRVDSANMPLTNSIGPIGPRVDGADSAEARQGRQHAISICHQAPIGK